MSGKPRNHLWILEVTGNPKLWDWRAEATERGGLVIRAFKSRAEAKQDLYEARQKYGFARLIKYTAGEIANA